MAARPRSRTEPTTEEADLASATSGQDIAQRLTFLLHRLVSALVDAAGPEYREYGLSIPAARTIVSLLESGGSASVGSLAETTCIDLSTMSHILRRLEAQKYLKRQRQTDDNRVVIAVLTAKGAEIARVCRQASLKHEAVLVRGMTEAEVARLKSALGIAFENARKGLQ
jgi:DNA-binding MarR family transcriptional regulator